jgi:hypothetical protein
VRSLVLALHLACGLSRLQSCLVQPTTTDLCRSDRIMQRTGLASSLEPVPVWFVPSEKIKLGARLTRTGSEPGRTVLGSVCNVSHTKLQASRTHAHMSVAKLIKI